MSFQSDWAAAIEELQDLTDKLQGEEVAHGRWWIDVTPGLITGGFFTQPQEESQAVFALNHMVQGATPGDLLDTQLIVAQGLAERARRILADRAVAS